VRGAERERPLLQRSRRRGDVHREVLARDSDSRHRRIARGEEDRAPERRHPADLHAALRLHALRRRPDRRRADIRSGARARADRRAPHDDLVSAEKVRRMSSNEHTLGTHAKARPLFDPEIVRGALVASVTKLDPRHQVRNPVMFVVLVGSILTTLLFLQALVGKGEAAPGFILAVSVWLWFTVLFANFAEAMAEGRGKAQADALRRARRDVVAKILDRVPSNGGFDPTKAHYVRATSADLRKGDLVLVEAGEFIPSDGEIMVGVASVDESAITGESAPVIREAGGDRSAVTGGTRVLSDWLVVRISSDPGETFLDRMISMVEGARRQKTPNEIALNILLAALTIVFLLATVTLLPFSIFAVKEAGQGLPVTMTTLTALLVCLIPTTIGGLLSAIGIAGMDRMIQANVIAMSGRSVEAAGDVDVLLLDKTGTITLGNRQATAFLPADGI